MKTRMGRPLVSALHPIVQSLHPKHKYCIICMSGKVSDSQADFERMEDEMMKKLIALLLCAMMLLGLCSVATAEEGLKVGLCIAETLGDKGFYDSANEGLQRLVADYGVVGSVVECKSDASAYTDALVGSAEQCDIVVAVGWQFWDALVEVVPQMPETKFIFIDNAMD